MTIRNSRPLLAWVVAFFFLVPVLADATPTGGAPAGVTSAQRHGCTECHRFSADDSQESAKGPDLFYAGDKFQEKWLQSFLRKPVMVRKAGYSGDPGFLRGEPTLTQPHPALADKDAAEMAQYLLSLKHPDLLTGKVDDEPLSKGKRARVKILFERDFSCIACHEGINLAGKARGGVSGPSLADAGNRLQPDWVYSWLQSPKIFLDKGRMPVYDLEDETAVLLTKYLMTLQLGSRQ